MPIRQAQGKRRGGDWGRAWVVLLVALVLVAAGIGGYLAYRQRARASAPAAKAGQLWTCPMHPQIIRDEPGNCPICGMALEPVPESARESAQAAAGETHKGIEGHGVVHIDPEHQQLIGVVTTTVSRRPLDRIVRTVGTVTVDESLLSDVHTKVEGWVEELYANQTGKLVRKGEPLLTIYSPELVSTQEEYLVAVRSRQRTANSPFPEVRSSGETLVAAARERLRLWDITDEQIARLERTGQVRKTLTLHAPSTGYVMEKMVVAGMRVMPEMSLYRLADLSRVWVDVAIYEYEAPLVSIGQRAELTLQSQPGAALRGRVTYIYPTVEAMTRTLKARLEFPNPGLLLKPDMYGDVQIMVPVAEQLAIPEEAVIDTGTRKVVFVAMDEGTFVPREVTLGPRAAGYYPVLSGLEEGEKVVSGANFLIDSESRFQAAIEAMGKGGAAGEHAGH
jgi:RND family efflux transporter MFP subunit